MGVQVATAFLALLFAGLLAGEELTVTLGVRGALASLDVASHLAARQALIYRLRVIVPTTFFLALVPAAASAILEPSATGAWARFAGVVLLLVWLAVTLLGTIPINAAALSWAPSAPPSDWRTLVERWERLNSVRTLSAVAAFAALLAAAALQA